MDIGERKNLLRRQFDKQQHDLLNEMWQRYGDKPTEMPIDWLSEKTGCDKKRLRRYFRNKRYEENRAKTVKRRFNSSMVTTREMKNVYS